MSRTLVSQVRLAKQLTLDGTIRPESIAILSPYSAQVSEINKSLQREGIRGVTVCTIMKSQGEGTGPGGLGLSPPAFLRSCSHIQSSSKPYPRVISAMEDQISGRFVMIINPLEASGVLGQGEAAEGRKVMDL